MAHPQKDSIVMCGCHEAGYNSIKWALEGGLKIDYFVLLKSEIVLKSQISGYKDFSLLAKKFKINIYYSKSYSLKHQHDIEFFKKNQFSLLIQGGWQRLFPKEVLKTLKIGAIGGHGSSDFLPKGRGRSPLNWSLIENKQRFIIHYFIIKPGIDDGDIFHIEMFDINQWDDIKTLYYKMALTTSKVFLKLLPKLMNGELPLKPQKGKPTYYLKRTANDGKINWEKDIFEIYNLVRAVTKPYPGAFTFYKKIKIYIWSAQPFDTRIDTIKHKFGEVIKIFENGDLIVKAGSGLLLITEYESEILILEGMVFE